jgi:hypothetical protein
MEAPFVNLYAVKHVSIGDSKACVLCYKPTEVVLITANKKDWFYVCSVHLKDKNFATLSYCDHTGLSKENEWKDLCNKVNSLQLEIHKMEREREKENRWLNSIKWNRNKDNDKDKNENEKSLKDDDKNVKSIKDVKIELDNANNELENFEKAYVHYKLESVFYRNRLIIDFKRRKQIETQEKLKRGELFPSLEGLSNLKKQKD